MLSGTITYLRGTHLAALSASGQVGAGSVTDDIGGGGTTVWNYATAIPCRIDPLTGDEDSVGGRLTERATHVITLPPETSISAVNRFQTAGATYEITAIRERTGEQVRRVEAVQIS